MSSSDKKLTQQLQGRVAIVTGGASGIGKATALAFAAAGASVVVGDIDRAGVEATTAEIVKNGGAAQSLLIDVRDQASISAAIDFTMESFGPVTIMANIAGIAGRREHGRLRLMDSTVEDFSSIVQTNVLSVLLCSQAAARVMSEHGGGVILNVASGTIDTSGAGIGLYVMSKAAVAMLSKTLAVELGPSGIRVNALAPFLTKTKYLDGHFEEGSEEEEKYFGAIISANPLGRLGLPEDVAKLAVFLASDEAEFISGQILRTNGAAATPW
jgi:3-oxoacyl-[acyl-carrier protein] reductase